MAFLDFLKRQSSEQQPVAETTQQQKPETAKEMYTREAAQEQSSRKSVEHLPDSVKQEAVDAARPAAKLMDQATSHSRGHDAGGQTDGKEALVHNQSAQEKSQEPMSPTDANRGHSRGRGMER